MKKPGELLPYRDIRSGAPSSFLSDHVKSPISQCVCEAYSSLLQCCCIYIPSRIVSTLKFIANLFIRFTYAIALMKISYDNLTSSMTVQVIMNIFTRATIHQSRGSVTRPCSWLRAETATPRRNARHRSLAHYRASSTSAATTITANSTAAVGLTIVRSPYSISNARNVEKLIITLKRVLEFD